MTKMVGRSGVKLVVQGVGGGKNVFKSTRDGCSESDESNSINGILEENEATQMACNVTDNGSTSTDEENRNDEARITVGNT